MHRRGKRKVNTRFNYKLKAIKCDGKRQYAN